MQIPFELYNNTDTKMEGTIKANQTIDVFKTNLFKKQLYVSSLTFSDELIPKFIPQYIYGDVNAFRQGIFNYISTLVNLFNQDGQWGEQIPTINMTPYYVLCSVQQPGGTNYFLQFVSHAPDAKKTPPYSYPSSKISYYEDSYYQYSDFSIFMEQIQNSMSYILDQLAISNGINYTGEAFYITTSNDTINLYVNDQIFNAPNTTVKLYMSSNLITLLNINGRPVSGTTMFNEVPFKINNGDYMLCELPTDTSKICPVKQILLDTNLPTENVQFYSSNNAPNIKEERATILMLYYTPSTIFQASNIASYVAAMPIPYIYFNTDTNNSSLYPEFRLLLRMNNGIVIPHMLSPSDYVNLTFRLEIKNN